MTEQQLNGYQRLIPAQADQVQRDAGDVEDLDVPNFLKDDQRDQVETSDTSREFPQATNSPLSADRHQTETLQTSEGLTANDADEPRRPFHRTRIVAGHRVTRAGARHVLYVGTGAAVTRSRRRDAMSTARHERMMRAAEAAGDHVTALEWEQRAHAHKQARHARRMALMHAPAHIARGAVYTVGGTVGGLLLLGGCLAAASHDGHLVTVPLMDAVDVVRFVVVLASILWRPALAVAALVSVAALWHHGRAHALATNTGWAARLLPAGNEVSAIITADAIVQALQHLGLPKLNTAFKNAWLPKFVTTPIREGYGYRAIFELPLGVTPSDVADKRELFARNLHRAPIEVWVTDAVQAGTGAAGLVDLWVADPGVLNKPAPEYPLLHEGTADVFAGVPGGVSPRGEAVLVPIVGNNFVAGGMMGQGKSNLCRVVMLGSALDPLAQLWVFVFAGNGDFDSYAPRLARYHRGVGDEVAATAVASLVELYEEVARREGRLAELGAKKVTRALAEQHPDLRPIVALFSECHELFGHKDFGEQAADVAVQTIRRGRKTAITLGFDTQSSRKEAIPPKIVELVSVNCCFAVKSWRSNDGFLGDGSFAAGIRATELRPGRDRGTSLATGVSDEQFEIVRWYFVEVDDDSGFDAAADVIARAVAGVASGTTTAATAQQPIVIMRDLLEDLAEVLTGTDPVPIADVPALLRDLAPGWAPYVALKGTTLREKLADDYGIKTPSTGNRWPLDPAAVRQAVARRQGAEQSE